MRVMYGISVVLVFILIGYMPVFCGGDLLWFIDPLGILLVLLPPFILSLAVYTPVEIAGHYAVAFTKAPVDQKRLKHARIFFRRLSTYFLLAGIFGTLYGIIYVLANMIDEGGAGVGLSSAFMTLYYAVIFIIIFAVPFQQAIGMKIRKSREVL